MLLSCGEGIFSEPFPFLVGELEALGVSPDGIRRDAGLGDIDGEAGGELLVDEDERHFLVFPRW